MTIDLKKRILIVEDSPAIAMYEEFVLKTLGYDVLGPVVTGAQAVQMALDEKPDAVLMDIELVGDMNGVEAAHKICENPDISVVFVTAYADQEKLNWPNAPKGALFVVKPYTKDEIAEAFEKALSK